MKRVSCEITWTKTKTDEEGRIYWLHSSTVVGGASILVWHVSLISDDMSGSLYHLCSKGEICNIFTVINHKMAMISSEIKQTCQVEILTSLTTLQSRCPPLKCPFPDRITVFLCPFNVYYS